MRGGRWGFGLLFTLFIEASVNSFYFDLNTYLYLCIFQTTQRNLDRICSGWSSSNILAQRVRMSVVRHDFQLVILQVNKRFILRFARPCHPILDATRWDKTRGD